MGGMRRAASYGGEKGGGEGGTRCKLAKGVGDRFPCARFMKASGAGQVWRNKSDEGWLFVSNRLWST